MDDFRTRSSGNLLAKPSYRIRTFSGPCPLTWQPWGSPTLGNQGLGVYKSMRDKVIPGFTKLKASGQRLPLNEMTATTISSISTGSSNLMFTSTVIACLPSTKSQAEAEGAVLGATSTGLGNIAVLENHRVQNLIGQVETSCLAKRQAGDANYFETLAEADQAFGLFTSPFQNLERFSRAFITHPDYKRLWKLRSWKSKARLTRRYARELARLASSEWLRFRYGVTPIVNDVKAALKTLQDTYDRGPKDHTARAQGTITAQTSVVGGFSIFGLAYVDTLTVYQHTVSVRAQWTDRYQQTPFDKLGFTFQNVIGLGWELANKSFVWDWFFNVGDLIYANMPRVGVESLGGTRSLWDVRTSNMQATKTTYTEVPPSYTLSGSVSDGLTIARVDKQRVIMDGSTKFVMRDDFRLDDFNRATDAMALAFGALRKIAL